MTKLSKIALPLLAATAVAPIATATVAQAAGSERTISAYTTGYSYYDNTPAGSAQIMSPQIHSVAGGTGTYSNPITVAIGTDGQFEMGQRFYVPALHRYFIAEDSGGSLLNSPRSGADAWLDLWVGGSGMSESAVDRCMGKITGVHTVIVNPDSDYPVSSGSIAGNCSTFSDSVSRSSSSDDSDDSDDSDAKELSASPKPTATKTSSAPKYSAAKVESVKAEKKESKDEVKPAKPTTAVAAKIEKKADKAEAKAEKKADKAEKKASKYSAAKVTSTKKSTKAKRYYTVKPGDSLFEIARENGVSSWEKLYQLNDDKIDDPDLIYVGQRFVLN